MFVCLRDGEMSKGLLTGPKGRNLKNYEARVVSSRILLDVILKCERRVVRAWDDCQMPPGLDATDDAE